MYNTFALLVDLVARAAQPLGRHNAELSTITYTNVAPRKTPHSTVVSSITILLAKQKPDTCERCRALYFLFCTCCFCFERSVTFLATNYSVVYFYPCCKYFFEKSFCYPHKIICNKRAINQGALHTYFCIHFLVTCNIV